MHLYVMQKSEILLTLVTFVSMFVLCLFIGLAGPNSVRLDSVKATQMLQQQQQEQQQQSTSQFEQVNTNQDLNDARQVALINTRQLLSEKYIIITPLVSSYCQQLNLWIKFHLINATNQQWPPERTTDEADDYGLSDLLGTGRPVFYSSKRFKSNRPSSLVQTVATVQQQQQQHLDKPNRSDPLLRVTKDGEELVNNQLKSSINNYQIELPDENNNSNSNNDFLNNLPLSLYLNVEIFDNDNQSSQMSSINSVSKFNISLLSNRRQDGQTKGASNISQITYSKNRNVVNQQQQYLTTTTTNGPLFKELSCTTTTTTTTVSNSNFEETPPIIDCHPFEIVHLTGLQYASYKFNIQINNETIEKILTISQQQNVHLKEITFTLQSINTSFTIMIIWFRFVLLLVSTATTYLFVNCLYKYPFRDWSLEQRWTTLLLMMLIVSDSKL